MSDRPNNDVEIGFWDPSSISKSNFSSLSQPRHQQHPQQQQQQQPVNYSSYAAQGPQWTSSPNVQSHQGPAHSMPPPPPPPPPPQQQQSQYSNLASLQSSSNARDYDPYSTAESYQGYTQQGAQNTRPSNNREFLSADAGTGNFYPPSQWSSGDSQPPLQQQSRARSDNLNWRNPQETSGPSEATYTPQYNYRPQQSMPQQPRQHYSDFVNPLNQNDDEDDGESADVKVSRMKQAAEEAKALQESVMRKQTTISKAALVQLQNDLQQAAAPFQSPELLQKYRNMHLGISSDDHSSDVSDAVAGKILENSKLSANAAEFVPRSAVKQTRNNVALPEGDDQNEIPALELTNSCVDKLIVQPACFDDIIPEMTEKLRGFNLGVSSIKKIVEVIYEMCILEPNFRYLGAQLCDTLSRSKTGLPKFRSTLLSKAQSEFQSMEEALSGDEKAIERAHGFTRFVAELFRSLMLERSNGTLERFAILGRALLDAVIKLVRHPNDDNIQCAIRVLKLTVATMEDTLKSDDKGSSAKLEKLLDDLCEFLDASKSSVQLKDTTVELLAGFKKLRSENWGRVAPEDPEWSSSKSKEYFPQQDHKDPNSARFIGNEPVFFTPAGKDYQASDAADPEFVQAYLAPHCPPCLFDEDDNPVLNLEGNPYAAFDPDWDPQFLEDEFDPSLYDNPPSEDNDDDYDEELDKFLNNIPK